MIYLISLFEDYVQLWAPGHDDAQDIEGEVVLQYTAVSDFSNADSPFARAGIDSYARLREFAAQHRTLATDDETGEIVVPDRVASPPLKRRRPGVQPAAARS